MLETQLIDDAGKEFGYIRRSFIAKGHGKEGVMEDLKYDSISDAASSMFDDLKRGKPFGEIKKDG
jgi:hypothetical protein